MFEYDIEVTSTGDVFINGVFIQSGCFSSEEISKALIKYIDEVI